MKGKEKLEGHGDSTSGEWQSETFAQARLEPRKSTQKLLLLTQQCVSCEGSMSCDFMCCVRTK
jgi:hypothetical protein